MHSHFRLLTVIAAYTICSPAPGWAQASGAVVPPAAASCKALESADFSGILDAPTQVIEAKVIPASADLPAYCRVEGYVASHIGIEMRLPIANWNGKFLEVGCGGMCGSTGFFMQWFCDNPLRRGYACISSDMGHKSTTLEGMSLYNNLQAKIDWSYLTPHVAALAGKAITERYYTRAPSRSYFHGCSTGGHEGMVEAQRFPWDFDGIIAGAPGSDVSSAASRLAWLITIVRETDGTPILSGADVQLIHDAVVATCDLNDNVKDGLIGDPRRCNFDPNQLVCSVGKASGCLSQAQTEVVRKIYRGPTNSRGEQLYTGGLSLGSELDWHNWWLTGADRQLPSTFNLAIDLLRYFAFTPDAGPTWNLADMNYDRDYKRWGMTESLYSISNPDLRKFKAAGGKLIVYQGWSDGINGPLFPIDYYETVEKTMGGRPATQDFFRLFMLPGMTHCEGGEGAYAVDYLSYLEAWVEEGKPPDVMLSAHPKDHQAGQSTKFPLDADAITFTRPVYPYPFAAKYRGHGDPNDAANFGVVKR